MNYRDQNFYPVCPLHGTGDWSSGKRKEWKKKVKSEKFDGRRSHRAEPATCITLILL